MKSQCHIQLQSSEKMIGSAEGREWKVEIHQVSHMANAAADYLAKEGLACMLGFILFQQANPGFSSILCSDPR
ncbi:hypothetical protein K1719_036121 [Acacia pycnantha]|nr:hypothetical protein K1719_036121 [Acacia pycnantha]